MTGFVYAIGDGQGRVKIGWSGDPLRRRSKLQSDCPTKADLYGVVQATKAQENEIHELLDPWHLHGDWFELTGLVKVFVGMLQKPHPREVAFDLSTVSPLRRYRIERGITLAQLAAQIRTSHATLSRLETGHHFPRRGLLKRLVATTGLTADQLLKAVVA